MSQNGADYYATYGGYDLPVDPLPLLSGNKSGADRRRFHYCERRDQSALDILSQIVYAEMSSTMHPEAMKAQAVAAYTYIMSQRRQ